MVAPSIYGTLLERFPDAKNFVSTITEILDTNGHIEDELMTESATQNSGIQKTIDSTVLSIDSISDDDSIDFVENFDTIEEIDEMKIIGED